MLCFDEVFKSLGDRGWGRNASQKAKQGSFTGWGTSPCDWSLGAERDSTRFCTESSAGGGSKKILTSMEGDRAEGNQLTAIF